VTSQISSSGMWAICATAKSRFSPAEPVGTGKGLLLSIIIGMLLLSARLLFYW
jgi:hypothetical protein